MQISENLILKKGEDITSKVKSCKYNEDASNYEIVFSGSNERVYTYSSTSLEWVNTYEQIDPSLVRISICGKSLFDIQQIRLFKAATKDYWYIRFGNGTEKIYDLSKLQVTNSCLNESEARNCLEYLREIAYTNELKNDQGELIFIKHYEKLKFIDKASVMALYLNVDSAEARKYEKRPFIFPFGGNTSQFKAVEEALCNQISVIKGPPGTGKTQTILNIIANLLVENKTVQIVSNNNSATENVAEKLSSPQYNLGFLVAALGSAEKNELFLQNQTGNYPDFASWQRGVAIQDELREKTKELCIHLKEGFVKQERLAQARQELDALLLEIQYFDQYFNESGIKFPPMYISKTLKSRLILSLLQDCNEFVEKNCKIPFWFKLKCVFIRDIGRWRFYKNDISIIITLMQSLFYSSKKTELENEIAELEKFLIEYNIKKMMPALTSLSMEYLRAVLYDKFSKNATRTIFKSEDLWKNSNEVIREYPIVLSTAFSSRKCLKDAMYDYLIMDEASQVDIATGALALSGAKNAVIVGDLRQLSNIVPPAIGKRCDAVFAKYKLADAYSYSQNSLLSSVCTLFENMPQTLLREHYRCHPKIIGFCNQKFYNNELIIMTKDNDEKDVLTVIKTVEGSQSNSKTNQRQIDVTLREALPLYKEYSEKDIGIIAPYKDHVKITNEHLSSSQIEIDTVHKFQGREKDVIIFTSVDNTITPFSDSQDLLNVAVSRAKKKFCLIVSGNEQPANTNTGDLIDYIEYNNFSVIHSKIYSVFDLLYKQYTDARIRFLKDNLQVSQYDSENIMYATIVDLLSKFPQLPLSVIIHQPLKMLIRDFQYLNEEEYHYTMNQSTHLDFLIYNIISKKPVLVIEVDGFRFHKPGSSQYERDRKKDAILQKYDIPLKRFPTNGSGEIEWLTQYLTSVSFNCNE